MVRVTVFVALALALLAAAAAYRQPDATILLKVDPQTPAQHLQRRNDDLRLQLHQVKSDALQLYTEYCSKAATDLKSFLGNVTALAEDTLQRVYTTLASSPEDCRRVFQIKLRKVEGDAHKAATFSTETHHKFLLGHMIVFRMHLNKSEELIKRCDRTVRTNPRVSRWRRLASCEINRVRDDISHARRAYADLIVHACRKLNHLRKHANAKLEAATRKLLECARETNQEEVSNEKK